MAVCAWCEQEMTVAWSCTTKAFHLGGVPVALAPWGSERHWRRPKAGQRCGDCGVAPGGHHHPGCDIAECPRCGRQLMSCGCRFDEDPPDEDEFDEDDE